MNAKADFNLTGFLVGLIIIAMAMSGLSIFMAGLQESYDFEGNDSLSKYDYTDTLLQDTEQIKDSVNINQSSNWLDVIGGYFSGGWSAIKTSYYSVRLYDDMTSDLVEDIDFFEKFKIKEYLFMILIMILFIGVGVTVLVKRRV